MEAARLHKDSKAAQDSSRPTYKRQGWDHDGDTDAGEPQCKHRRTTTGTAPWGSSNIEHLQPSILGTEDGASEDESYASLTQNTLPACL